MSGKPKKAVLFEDDKGTKARSGIDAYIYILESESFAGKIRQNLLTGRGEIMVSDDGEPEVWKNIEDADISKLRWYFQNVAGLNSRVDMDDALNTIFSMHQTDPVVEKLDSLEWDGQTRIQRFLTDIAKADDTEYVHEVSRLIFAGGVHRAYEPGCKFDDMPVLVGHQGGGKSSLVRFLNMNDDWYKEVTTIQGKEGIEAIQGGWVCEFSEMMAMTNIKEIEGVKAYVTRLTDHVRKAYGRYESDLKRHCMFIGTTNNDRFLTDKTGNRRFYPVNVRISGYDLYDHEQEVRQYVEQCWAEAVTLYRKHELPAYADRKLAEVIRAEQENAMEDDWREGKIIEFLGTKKKGEYTCVL